MSGKPTWGFYDQNNNNEWTQMTIQRFVLHEFHHAVQYHEGFDAGSRESQARVYADNHVTDGTIRGASGAIVPNPKSVPHTNGIYTASKNTPPHIVLSMVEAMTDLHETVDARFGTSPTGFHIEIAPNDDTVRIDPQSRKVTLTMSEVFFSNIAQGHPTVGYQDIKGYARPLRMNRLMAHLDVYAHMFDLDPNLKVEALANGGAIPSSVQRNAIEFINGLFGGFGADWDPSSPALIPYTPPPAQESTSTIDVSGSVNIGGG